MHKVACRARTLRLSIYVNEETDADVVERMDECIGGIGISGYVRKLVREDIAREGRCRSGKLAGSSAQSHSTKS